MEAPAEDETASETILLEQSLLEKGMLGEELLKVMVYRYRCWGKSEIMLMETVVIKTVVMIRTTKVMAVLKVFVAHA